MANAKDSLVELRYSNTNQSLTVYADMLAWYQEGEDKILAAAHFGGESETVAGFAAAIYGGANITFYADRNYTTLRCPRKRLERSVTHNQRYDEGLVWLWDDEITEMAAEQEEDAAEEAEKQTSRNAYIFCAPGDRSCLFSKIESKILTPTIPQWQDYILDELIRRNLLISLEVISQCPLEGWRLILEPDEKGIAAILEDGLRMGAITIPGAVKEDNAFDGICDFPGYIEAFLPDLTGKIAKQYLPLFDPEQDRLCRGLRQINSHIHKQVGYHLYPAQLAAAEAVKRRLEHAHAAIVVGECGAGKSVTRLLLKR